MQCRPQLQHGDTGGRQEPKVAVWGLLGGALRVTGYLGRLRRHSGLATGNARREGP